MLFCQKLSLGGGKRTVGKPLQVLLGGLWILDGGAHTNNKGRGVSADSWTAGLLRFSPKCQWRSLPCVSFTTSPFLGCHAGGGRWWFIVLVGHRHVTCKFHAVATLSWFWEKALFSQEDSSWILALPCINSGLWLSCLSSPEPQSSHLHNRNNSFCLKGLFRGIYF